MGRSPIGRRFERGFASGHQFMRHVRTDRPQPLNSLRCRSIRVIYHERQVCRGSAELGQRQLLEARDRMRGEHAASRRDRPRWTEVVVLVGNRHRGPDEAPWRSVYRKRRAPRRPPATRRATSRRAGQTLRRVGRQQASAVGSPSLVAPGLPSELTCARRSRDPRPTGRLPSLQSRRSPRVAPCGPDSRAARRGCANSDGSKDTYNPSEEGFQNPRLGDAVRTYRKPSEQRPVLRPKPAARDFHGGEIVGIAAAARERS